MKLELTATAATALAIAMASPAYAQMAPMDHSAHSAPAPTPSPTPAPAPSPSSAPVPAPMDMSGMDHSAMDHSTMDHSKMDHSKMDHSGMESMDSMPGMDHGSDAAMAGMAMGGEGSGTSRLPANEAMDHGLHLPLGKGSLMLHGFAWGVHTDQGGPRGDDKTYVQSMAMLTYERPFEGGKLTARTMMSAEPLMRHDGYPNLFATGEVAYGEPLVDRQHPHDLFMELAARLDLDVAEGTRVFIYGGPVGEPALGPSAFMHRASAKYNPEAPITHHWFDSTHITYGVVTAGIANERFQFEGSAFRGREPDEFRWNIESPKLDSWSVRASFAPSPAWLVQASYGHIKEPEETHPGEDENRTTVSAHYNSGNGLSAMAAFSAKDRSPGTTLTAWLGEANWDLTKHHTLFARAENVANDELFPDHASPLHDQKFRVTKLQAGYAYRLPLGETFNLALGGTVAAFMKPDALDPYYGRHPMGYTVFAKLSLGD
ncbi:hypothetical protein ACFO0A_09275 [Novosphingobium tardum]|uniref:Copper oxidase n=1 Tax=Novosphingobium tardum TaxID=1538021 RepID=A0ABV8RPE9_9SPHN